VQQPVQQRRGHAHRVVGGVVGLQPGGEPAGQAERPAQAGDHPGPPGDGDQVGVAHQLRGRGDHLGRQTRCQRADRVLVALRRADEQPLAQLADRQPRDRGERLRVVGVQDQPGDVVVLVGDDLLLQEHRQRQVRQDVLRGDPLGLGLRSAAGEHVAGAGRGRLGQQV